MAHQLTRWRPDSCGCVVDFSWDSDDAEPVHVAQAIVPCEVHPATGDLAADFQTIIEHCRAANPPGG